MFTIGTNFSDSTILDSGFIPPDTMGAVGPDHAVVLINGRYAVYDKSGAFVSGSSLDSFWTSSGVTPSGSFSFDPRINYDAASGRWFAASVDNGGAANNYLVAVSNTSDPTAGWTGFKIDSDTNNSDWADFPMMGITATTVTLAANMFPVGGGPATTTNVLVIPKSDLLGAVPTVANATLFQDIPAGSTGFAMQPVVDLTGGGLPQTLLSSYNKGTGTLKTSQIAGTPFAPTLVTAGGFIGVTPRSGPPTIDQSGPKANINAGDTRFSGNVIQQHTPGRVNDSLWAVHSVDVGGLAAIEWYEIDAVTGAVLQSGIISDPSLGFNFPSIAVNADGDVVIGFSGASPSTFMSTYVVVGKTTAGVTSFSPVTLTKAGLADYQRLDGSGRNRWGDYSATVLDPSDSKSFWTFQEFAAAGTNIWQIQVTQILIPTAPPAFPEPGTLVMAGIGIVGMAFARRRNRKPVASNA